MLQYLLTKVETPLMLLCDQKVSSPAVYRALLCKTGLHTTSDLLKKFIESFEDEHLDTFLILFEYQQNVSCKKLAEYAIEQGKTQIAFSLMCKSKSKECYNILKKVAVHFDEKLIVEFLLNCSPKMKRDLIRIVLFSCENFKKRKSIIHHVLNSSGSIHTADAIDFIKVLRHSMDFLLSDPNILQDLLKIGFSFGKPTKGLTKLILKKQDQLKERTDILCILLENGVDIDDLSFAYSRTENGTPFHAATELAVKTGEFFNCWNRNIIIV